MESFKSYKRIELEDNILYVRPELPDWIVPTPKADFIISNLQKNVANEEIEAAYCEKFSVSQATAHFAIDKVKKRFLPGNITAYNGRKNFRELTELTECWFHLTNKCNMACRHCMFSSNSNETGSIPFDLVLKSIDEAISLGCKIFYFTGGEPFIYPGFTEVCEYILEKENTHIVILTNAKNIKNFDLWLDKIPKDRVHFQVSIDGLKENHDNLKRRGCI